MSAAVKLGYQQWMEHREAADRLDRLREHGERSWREALKDHNASTVEQDSRALQDEIFDGRKRNPLVFDLVFKRLRADQEAQMNFGRGIRHGGRTSTSRKGRPASSVLTNRSSDCSGDRLASTACIYKGSSGPMGGGRGRRGALLYELGHCVALH